MSIRGTPACFSFMGLTSASEAGIFVCMRDFYRVQCLETGQGPYQSGDYDCIKTPSSERHPTPWNEGLWDRSKWLEDGYHEEQQSFVCGFESIQQLLAWFDIDSLQRLQSSSTRWKRHYDVIHFQSHEAHMQVARCQAVARKSLLVEVSRQSLEEFIQDVSVPMYARELTFRDSRFTLVS